ncbi:MAG: hypothetical protein H0V80_15800 [Acidobacteria bacterium]|nr:hypothetical protein [Acidobacteriota bacterium]
MASRKRDIGQEILDGLAELKRGEHGRMTALVHGSTLDSQSSQPKASSPTDRNRLGPAKPGHPIQDAARKARLDAPATTTAGA